MHTAGIIVEPTVIIGAIATVAIIITDIIFHVVLLFQPIIIQQVNVIVGIIIE